MKSTSRRSWRQGLKAGLALVGVAAFISACPLYSDCDDSGDCARGWRCDIYSRRCEPVEETASCTRPSDCLAGETCAPDSVCRPGSCDYHGCVRGYRCGVVDRTHTCVAEAVDAGAEASVTPADSGAEPAKPDPADASMEPPADANAPDSGELDSGTADADAG